MKLLGERIKRKRETMQISLGELARRVGVSASALSQIENSKSVPTIVTLKAIAESLHTSVGELIGENEAITKNPLVRFEEKTLAGNNESGTTVYLLSNPGNLKQMETCLLQFNEGANGDDIMRLHPGQEFCYVLQGELEFRLEDKKYILQKNDSFYFNSNREHSVRNRANGITQVLWIITPPES